MCKSPLSVKVERSDGFRHIPVPCGKCKLCISQRVSSWQWRLEQELRISTSPYFVTLTYDRKHCPISECDWNGSVRKFRVLNPKHFTDYLKRLRFHYGKSSERTIRYFGVGEYGTKRGRPHYHLVLLNCDDVRLIQDTWHYGHVDISPLRGVESVSYCLGYLYKRKGFAPPNHPPFSRMSKGLGRNYLTKEVIKFHKRKIDNTTVELQNGKSIPLPKYFKDRIYSESERYELSYYLQSQADIRLDKRVASIVQATGRDEADVRRSLFVEPFVERPKKPKASIM